MKTFLAAAVLLLATPVFSQAQPASEASIRELDTAADDGDE